MNREEKRYLIKERAEMDVEKHDSIEKAIKYLKTELEFGGDILVNA